MMKRNFCAYCALAVLLVAGTGFSGCRRTPRAAPPSPTPAPDTAANAAPKPPEAPKANRSAEVIVFGYHRFVDTVRRPDTEITPAAFDAQMQQLKDEGIAVIPLRDLLAWKRGEKEIPEKSAVITLDDGWNSQYYKAWPILKKFDYPFTVFIYTDYVKGGRKSGGESITWEQLAEMRDAGVQIESHTVSHSDLRSRKRAAANPQEYEKWLWEELHGSKQMLEQQLGIRVTALALPYGYYNHKVQEMAKEAGYEAIFTVNGSHITFSQGNTMGRYVIESNKPKVFALAVRFTNSHGGGGPATAVASIPAGAVAPHPADGAAANDARPVIAASLKPFGPVDPGSPSMRLSGVGVVKADYDPASGKISYQPKADLPAGDYTVIVTARSGEKARETRWRFTVGKPEAVAAPPGE